MDLYGIVSTLLIGLVAGWLAGLILTGKGFGLVGNLIIGVLGAFVGSFLFAVVGISANRLIGEIICATVGAVVLLLVLGILRKKGVI